VVVVTVLGVLLVLLTVVDSVIGFVVVLSGLVEVDRSGVELVVSSLYFEVEEIRDEVVNSLLGVVDVICDNEENGLLVVVSFKVVDLVLILLVVVEVVSVVVS
jgi:hypothetical protein